MARTAWVSDDAFITLRTVHNVLNGYGLTWNVTERVQSFTHPLWFFVLLFAHAITGEPFYGTLAAGVVFSLAALATLVPLARDRWLAVVGIGALVGSRAFVDYSTSGLEAPLSHLLLGLMMLGLAKRVDPFWIGLLGCLAMTNRLDLAVFVGPMLLATLAQRLELRTLAKIAAGFLPLVAWELFSLVWFGFLVPNTAFAKLGVPIPRADLIEQGLYYLRNSVVVDRITVPTIVLAAVIGLVRDWRTSAPLVLGIMAHAAYIVWIGGDFMSGRFLTPALMVAVGVLVQTLPPMSPKVALPSLFALGLLAVAAPHPALLGGPDFGTERRTWGDKIDRRGISDERAFWYPCAGLMSANRRERPVDCRRKRTLDEHRDNERTVIVAGGVGFLGYYAGPDMYIIDHYGLTDALMARIPPVIRIEWRQGHLKRRVPDGYVETLETGEPQFADPDIEAYWQGLQTIITGDLFTADRWRAIVAYNQRVHDHLLLDDDDEPEGDDDTDSVEDTDSVTDTKNAESSTLAEVTFPLSARRPRGADKCRGDVTGYLRYGWTFTADRPLDGQALAVRFGENQDVDMHLLSNGERVHTIKVSQDGNDPKKLHTHCFPIPPELTDIDGVHWDPQTFDVACFGYMRRVARCP